MSKMELMALTAAAALISACDGATQEPVASAELPGYVLASSIWHSSNIPVCWENMPAGYDEERG